MSRGCRRRQELACCCVLEGGRVSGAEAEALKVDAGGGSVKDSGQWW